MRIDNAQFTGSATGTQATATLSGSFSGSHEGTGARLTQVTASKLLFSASYGLGIENTFDYDATSNQSISVDTGSTHFIDGVSKVADSTVDTGSFIITSSDAKASTGQIIFEQGDGTLFSQSIVAASTVGSLSAGFGIDAFVYNGSTSQVTNIATGSARFIAGVSKLTGSFVDGISIVGASLTASKGDGTETRLRITNAETASFVTAPSVVGPFGKNSIMSASYAATSSFFQGTVNNSTFTNVTASSIQATGSFKGNLDGTASYASKVENSLDQGLGIETFTYDGDIAGVVVQLDTGSSHFTLGVSASQASTLTALSASLTTTDQTISASLAALSGSASVARGLLTGDSTSNSASFNARINSNDVDILGLNVYSASLKDAITVSGDSITVLGDLTVNGTRTIVNSTQVDIGDNTISLNGVQGALKGGIEVTDPTGPATGSLLWDSATNYWIAGPSQSESRILTAQGLGILSSSAQIAGDISGSFTLVSASFSTSQTALSASVSTDLTALNGSLTSISASFSTSQTALSSSVSTDLTALSGSTSTAREDYFNTVSVSPTTNTITLTKGDGATSVESLVSSSYAVTASHAITSSHALDIENQIVDYNTLGTEFTSITTTATPGATYNLDFTSGAVWDVTANAATTTFTISNQQPGDVKTVIFDGNGQTGIALPAAVKVVGGNAASAIDMTAGKKNAISILCYDVNASVFVATINNEV